MAKPRWKKAAEKVGAIAGKVAQEPRADDTPPEGETAPPAGKQPPAKKPGKKGTAPAPVDVDWKRVVRMTTPMAGPTFQIGARELYLAPDKGTANRLVENGLATAIDKTYDVSPREVDEFEAQCAAAEAAQSADITAT